MKKVLLATTAISMLAASAAYAEGPEATLGGTINFQVGGTDQDENYEDTNGGAFTPNRKTHVRQTADIEISIDGKSDNGLGYGGKVVLNADTGGDPEGFGTDADTENATESYIYVESAYGRAELGATTGVNDKLKVNAATFARATGGIAGHFHNYVNLTGNQSDANDSFIVTPDLPSIAVAGDVAAGIHKERGIANKVSYFSPRIQGFQVGLSYTQDQNENGNATNFSTGLGQGANDFEHLWEAALNYQAQYDQIGVEASVVGEWADHESPLTTNGDPTAAGARDGIEAYELGLALNYAGFTVGGSWADIDEHGAFTGDGQEANYWTIGGAYEFGPFAASITYLDSEVENVSVPATAVGINRDKEFTNLVIGADYQLAPGLVPYVEIAFFDTDDNVADTGQTSVPPRGDNEGSVILVGTALNF